MSKLFLRLRLALSSKRAPREKPVVDYVQDAYGGFIPALRTGQWVVEHRSDGTQVASQRLLPLSHLLAVVPHTKGDYIWRDGRRSPINA